MRNLRNIRYSTWKSPHEYRCRHITAAAWDIGSDSVICAYGPSENDTLIELIRVVLHKDSNSSEHTLITSWDAPPPNPELTYDQILNLHYFADTLTTCLVLAGGDIVVIKEEPMNGEERIEIVGSVDAGITAARWSPDEDLLAISTKADTFLFMSRSFDEVMDVAMTVEDLKASNHVSVGWGKKETQFKGKGAKPLRDPTVPEKIDEGALSPNDDGVVTISWRGDGAFVAISKVEARSRRLIRFYSREGILDSVSEPVDGLEEALSWRPAGNIVASIQRFPDHVDVVFFERNGLRHGQFSLRLLPEELGVSGKNMQLSWSHDSSVLAVVLENSVQLWTMGNYHWYLKQELSSPPHIQRPSNPVIWHPETALRFIIAGADDIVATEYVFGIAKGSTAPPNDHGAVAVIDGKELMITPFHAANVPPPLALHSVSAPQPISDIAFSADNSLIAILHHGGIATYSWDTKSLLSALPVLTGRFAFGKDDRDKGIPLQICIDTNGDVLTLQHSDGAKNTVYKYGFSMETGKIEEKSPDTALTSMITMISSFDQEGVNHAFAQEASGKLRSLQAVHDSHSFIDDKFPTFLPWAEVGSTVNGRLAFGLSQNGHLYANSRLLVRNCTSFLLTPLHLIFTTTTHLLKFVHITDVEDLEIAPDDPEKDERCRSIERGARLITAMPTSLSLLLQMPRGNLETIWPRAMVLAGIRKLVQEKNYKRAFAHCRTQRVDMNILCDHMPEQFISNVWLFIDQVKKISFIDLFLSSLREEDVSQTMYKETRIIPRLENGSITVNGVNGIQSDQHRSSTSKVNRICDAFLEVLKTRTVTNLQNVITANVCKSPPALEDGLLVVATFMNENEDLAEKAAEHICFLADVNKLYDTALGLYNLELALLVAQQSQKDPREYLPFLQNLQEMPLLRRQFSIDDHLGRHAKALSHLYELSQDDHSELETYTVKHALYKHALTIYRYQPSHLDSIMTLYASYLESRSQFYEAAIAYEYLCLYGSARTCYQRASPSHWRESLFCASQQSPPLSQEALNALAGALADSLSEAKDYESAAYIHTTYLSSIPTAITLLCKGYHFATALHLASLHSSTYPVLLSPGGPIDTGLTDALSTSTELLAECKSQLLAQVPRIRELHLKAASDQLAFYEGEIDKDLPDDVSVAASSRLSTSASLFTRYTGRQSQGTAATGVSRATSKNRRREERKRARGKKGSVYEEEYLVASVGRLAERVKNVKGEIENLIIGLVRRRMRERAQAMESLLGEVVKMCREAVHEVFGREMDEDKNVEAEYYRPVGGDAVLAESIEAARERKTAPVIGAFEKLSLLGAE